MPFAQGTGTSNAKRRLETVARNLSMSNPAVGNPALSSSYPTASSFSASSASTSTHGGASLSSSSSSSSSSSGIGPHHFHPPPPLESVGKSAQGGFGFDADLMGAYLFPDHRNLRARIREFLQSPRFKKPEGQLTVEQQRQWCSEAFQAILNEHFVSILDLKRDPYKYFALFETLYVADPSIAVKLSTHFNLFGAYVLNLGTDRHKKYLVDIDNGSLLGGFAMTELGHGSNVRQLETVAFYDKRAGEFIVNTPTYTAQKFWVGNALSCKSLIVFAMLIVEGERHGVHAFVVPVRSSNGSLLPGIHIADCGLKQGLNGVDHGVVRFQHVRVPRENLLNKIAEVNSSGDYSTHVPIERRFSFHIGELVVARLGTSCIANGLSATGLNIAIRYAHSRTQFSVSHSTKEEGLLVDYLSHQRRLFPHLATLYALTFFTQFCKRQFELRTDASREFHILVAGLKTACTSAANASLQSARECCGGQGYLVENLISQLRTDADALLTHDGDNHVMLQQVAHGALASTLADLETHRVKSSVTYFGKETATKIKEKNPIAIRQTSEEHLLNHDFHLAAFKYRETRQSYLLAKRLNRMTTRLKYPFFEAWNESTVEVTALAIAHIERTILEQFVSAVENLKVTELRHPLQLLVSLYALTRIEADPWFLRSGYLSNIKHEAVTHTINTVCNQVTPFSIGLIDAFRVPSQVLENTIAVGVEKYEQNDADWDTIKGLIKSPILEKEVSNSSWDLA